MVRIPSLADGATVVITACAITVTGVLVKREFLDDRQPTRPAPTVVEDATQYAESGQLVGSRDAPVMLIEFSDFQCQFCARFSNTVQAVMRAFPGKVALVYRHFPLTEAHPHAFGAALASECAAEQGKFTPFHDALFARQDSIGKITWEAFAITAGVADLRAFDTCVRDSVFRERVSRDIAAGKRVGVIGTPTFLLNDLLIRGAIDSAELSEHVRNALRDRETRARE